MPRPSETCGMRPNRTGGVGLPGCRTGDVHPAEMSDVSPLGACYGLTPGAADGRGLP
jgi:hypothetical protein